MTKEHAIEYGEWRMKSIKLLFHNKPLIDGICMKLMAHGSYSIPFNLKLKRENVKLVLFRRID